jgi:RNA polymerase-binding transcription factor DksA
MSLKVSGSSCEGETIMHYHYLTIEQRETLTSLVHAQLAAGAQLNIALQRLREPDYGVCIDCSRDIGFVRLRQNPWTLHCQACALLPITAEA